MPRAPRLDYPGPFHHVVARGVERREIFVSDDERAEFLDRLSTRVTDSDAAAAGVDLRLYDAHAADDLPSTAARR
jgi:hypothetical protein